MSNFILELVDEEGNALGEVELSDRLTVDQVKVRRADLP